MLTSLSLPSQHQGHHCICIPVSLSISLSFSFTLWMVHLAYMTEWIHNPGQFKIPRGPVRIKWNHKSRKDCCTTICSSLLFSSSHFMWLTNKTCPWPSWLGSTRCISWKQWVMSNINDMNIYSRIDRPLLNNNSPVQRLSTSHGQIWISPHVESVCMGLYKGRYLVFTL